MAITTKQQRQQRRSEALQLISDGVPPTDAAHSWRRHGGTTRLPQPAEWIGTPIGGSVFESVIVKVLPSSNAWNLLKSVSKIEAKFDTLEYQAVSSPQNRQDVKAAMQAIF